MLMVNKTDQDDFVKYVHQRVYKQNKNFICFFSGPTGSGKTYSALRFAEKLDENFDMDNVVFTPQEFMNLINGNGKELKQGSVILWEEIQTSMGHMDYQSFISKAINYVLTTFRHKNLILIVTAPYFSFINASSRKLFHAVFEVQRIDRNKSQTISKPLFLQINQRSGKVYYKYIKVARGNGATPSIKSYRLGLPGKDLLKEYEKRKSEFTENLNKEIMSEIDNRMSSKHKMLTQVQEKVANLLKEGKNFTQIASVLDMSIASAAKHGKAIQKKGYKLQKLTKNKESDPYYNLIPPDLA